jgi:hypothetical protein
LEKLTNQQIWQKLKKCKTNFLANMRGINNLYMREGIVISSMGDQICYGSQIDEIVFENANIRATDLSLFGIPYFQQLSIPQIFRNFRQSYPHFQHQMACRKIPTTKKKISPTKTKSRRIFHAKFIYK